jgi:hypothetical protein
MSKMGTQGNTNGNLIPMTPHQRATGAPGTIDAQADGNSDIDALFNVFRQAESSLKMERASSTKLQSELSALQSRYARESAHTQEQLKQYADAHLHLSTQLATTQGQLQAVTAQAKRLHDALAREKSERLEESKRLQNSLNNAKSEHEDRIAAAQLEMKMTKSALEHARGQTRELEHALASVRPQLTRAQSDLERVQADSLEREHRYQSMILAHQGRETQLSEALASMKNALHQARAEAAQIKASWKTAQQRLDLDSDQHKARHDETLAKAQELTQANRILTERLTVEKQRRAQQANLAKNDTDEKEMLLSALRLAESRVVAAEARLSEIMQDKSAASIPYFPVPENGMEFDGLEQLAVTGYPTISQ